MHIKDTSMTGTAKLMCLLIEIDDAPQMGAVSGKGIKTMLMFHKVDFPFKVYLSERFAGGEDDFSNLCLSIR
jgi:hypothetical protein